MSPFRKTTFGYQGANKTARLEYLGRCRCCQHSAGGQSVAVGGRGGEGGAYCEAIAGNGEEDALSLPNRSDALRWRGELKNS